MTIRLTPRNSMIHGSPEKEKHLPDLSALEGLGYTLVPIETLDVLNANPHARYPDPPLRRLADRGRYDAIVSGPDTMLVHGVYPRPPHGPVLRNGRLDTEGNGRSNFRGTVVTLSDGSVVMGRADGASQRGLQTRFAQPGNTVTAALGGGALLIENGAKVGHIDLLSVQLIGDNPGGMAARCMAAGVHTLMGVRGGKAYAGWCTGKSAKAVQDDFYAFEFGCVIKYAYGSAVFFDDCIDRLNGMNGTGFGIERAY
jgi:hypothetical protein